jgi:hypothetical protein
MFRFIFFIAFTLSSAAHAGWFSYDSYEDCMLGRMKGQNRMMYGAADKACKKQFGIPIDISQSDVKFHWHFSWAETAIIIEIEEAPADYIITSGRFRFSEKACADMKLEDIGPVVEIKFSHSKGLIEKKSLTGCIVPLSFMGK